MYSYRDLSVGLTTPRVRAHRAQHSRLSETGKRWRPWKRKQADKTVTDKLLIPLPIPHPVHIAIAIHNRDSEHPIPLDCELVWEILKAIEDCVRDVKVMNKYFVLNTKFNKFVIYLFR